MEMDLSDKPSAKKSKIATSFNRCRKPMPNLHSEKCSTKSLRNASKQLVEQLNSKFTFFPPLTTADKLCYKCRVELTKAYESSQESSGKKYINTTSYIYNFLFSCDCNVILVYLLKPPQVNMKPKEILTLVPDNWTIEQIQINFNATIHMIKVSRKLQKEFGLMCHPGNKTGKALSNSVFDTIIEFYKSEDHTYILPGKNDCVKIKNENNEYEYEQNRLVLCGLKELFKLFQNCHPDTKVGFSTFAKLRPKCCLLAGSSIQNAFSMCLSDTPKCKSIYYIKPIDNGYVQCKMFSEATAFENCKIID
ncbi:hypothetical protein TKK_0004081 [Trichogramma kaykai]